MAIGVTVLDNGAVDLVLGLDVERGNSGAGLWDDNGALVGIVTNGAGCPGPRCFAGIGGLASSVIGRAP